MNTSSSRRPLLLLLLCASACSSDEAPPLPPEADASLPSQPDGAVLGDAPDAAESAAWDGSSDPGSRDAGADTDAGPASLDHPTLIIVADGLRPEWVTPELMPFTAELAAGGADLSQHFVPYPSDPLVAAATLVTGGVPQEHGLYSSRAYAPGVEVRDVFGRARSASVPLPLGDVRTIANLDATLDGGLLQANSVLDRVSETGVRVAVWGMSGPTSIMNFRLRHQLLDDHVASPISWAQTIARATALKTTPLLPPATAALFPAIPTARSPYAEQLSLDLVPAYSPVSPPEVVSAPPSSDTLQTTPQVAESPRVPDPTRVVLASRWAPYLTYLGETFNYGVTLSDTPPDVAVVWLREPAASALRYGPHGASLPVILAAVDGQIAAMVRLVETRKGQGNVNVVVTSGRGVAAVAGSPDVFSRRALLQPTFGRTDTTAQYQDPRTGAISTTTVTKYTPATTQLSSAASDLRGVPSDGRVRLASLLRSAGFAEAQDGVDGYVNQSDIFRPGCSAPPLATSQLASVNSFVDLCVPIDETVLTSPTAESIVIAQGTGSDLLYMPAASSRFVRRVAAFLMGRPEIGAVLVSSRFDLPDGALPLEAALIGKRRGQTPDMAVVYAWDAEDVAGVPVRDATPSGGPGLGLFQRCSPSTPCRPGLFCEVSAKVFPAESLCIHCPELPASITDGLSAAERRARQQAQPGCLFDTNREVGIAKPWDAPNFVAARAAQRMATEGEFCDGPICAEGLSCVATTISFTNSQLAGTCLKPGGKADVIVPNVPLYAGTSYTGSGDGLGTSGGGSPAELHTVFIASGPGFKKGVKSSVPSGTVDIAPTLAKLWGVPFEAPSGRVLHEVLAGDDTEVTAVELEPIVSEPAADVPQYDPRSVKSDSTTRTGTKTFRTRITRAAVESDGKRYEYITSVGGTRE